MTIFHWLVYREVYQPQHMVLKKLNASYTEDKYKSFIYRTRIGLWSIKGERFLWCNQTLYRNHSTQYAL